MNPSIEQKMTSESNEQKIANIQDIFPAATEDQIAKILQYYDEDENKALDALTRDGGREALSNWAESNKNYRNKKKTKKGRRDTELGLGKETAKEFPEQKKKRKKFLEIFYKSTPYEKYSDEEEMEIKSFMKILEDLNNLLCSGEGNDVILKVQGEEFPAHKAILYARSSVFKSMFSHDMIEKGSGVVTIDDCDCTTFSDFLYYIYTGSTGHITNENVCSLYKASDKYDLQELKEACLLFMMNRLSVSIFCDVVSLALLYKEMDLIKLATEFFCRNALEIVKTPNWLTFLRINLTAGNELFIKALSSGTKVSTST